MSIEKYCVKCGKKFEAAGREVICPACKQAAAEETKRAAVERAKQASWRGESVPVRISGRASAVIRLYGKAHDMPFATALDALLKASDFFRGLGKAWEDITPYKSRRLKPQDAPQEVKAAKTAAKTKTVKAAKTAAKK